MDFRLSFKLIKSWTNKSGKTKYVIAILVNETLGKLKKKNRQSEIVN